MTIEIVSIVAESLSQSMAVIQHRSNTVKPKSVEMELLQPILTIGKQEVYDLVLAIVKAKRIPSRVLMSVTRIEVLIGVASKIAEALYLILYCM